MKCDCGQKADPGHTECYSCWQRAQGAACATMAPENKARIDAMTREQMAFHWRFAAVGDPLLQGVTGDYFSKVFGEMGGMSPEISKALGWGLS